MPGLVRPCASPGCHRQPAGAGGRRPRRRACAPAHAPGATLRAAGRSPEYRTWRAGRGGPGCPRVPLRATKAGAAGLVTSGYLQPPGAAGLVAELGAAGLERSPLCAKALGVEEKGGEGKALARGRQSREERAVRGSWPSWGRPTVRPKDTGTPYSAPPKSMAPAELGKGTGPDSSLWAPSREGARPVASAAPGSGEEVAGTGHFRLWWS